MEAAAPPPAPAPRPAGGSNQIQVGQVISDAFAIYSRNFGVLIGTSILVAIVVGVIVGLLNDAGGFFLQILASIVELIGAALFTGFVVRLVQDVRDGRRDMSVGDLFESAMPAIGSLILFSILYGIAVTIGLFLLIIPGLILMTIWAVGAPSIVAEGPGRSRLSGAATSSSAARPGPSSASSSACS